MNPRWTLLGTAALVALAACQRDPLDAKVSAATASAYDTWRFSVTSDASLDLRRRVDEALQEVRTQVAADLLRGKSEQSTVAAGVAAIDEALRRRINGQPLREVLQLGYELRVQRLRTELAGLEDAMKQNAKLVTKPGDLESRQHLEALRGRQEARVDKYRDELSAAERELAPLQKATGKTLLVPATEKPDEMPQRTK